MPGFWETMKRLAAGEPVYRASEQDGMQPKNEQPPTALASGAPAAQSPPSWPSPQKTGPKVYPEAVVKRVECSLEEGGMRLIVIMQNDSLERLMLDKILILGRTVELDHTIDPGQQRETMVYEGPMPANTNDSRCELHYRTGAGDYFKSVHTVDFKPEADGRYSLRRIRFIPPVKDI